MKALIFFFLFFTITFHANCQSSKLSVKYKGDVFEVPLTEYHENLYFSFSDFVKAFSLPRAIEKEGSTIEADFAKAGVSVTVGDPYVIIVNKYDKISRTIQLPVSPISVESKIYLPLKYSVDVLRLAFGKEIFLEDSLHMIISEKDILENEEISKSASKKLETNITGVSVYEKSGGLNVRISGDQRIPSYRSYYQDGSFTIVLNNVKLKSDSLIETNTDLVKSVKSDTTNDDVKLTLGINFDYKFSDISEIPGTNEIVVRINVEAVPSEWFKMESKNFTLIYHEGYASLAPYIIQCAENSLKLLMKLFDYKPSEKIIINTYDISDYGFGAATTTPQNYIRLEIEPLEPGYENIPYNERLKWIISHELVHIVVNDQASEVEDISRKIFQKVTPEQVQPISVFYSLLTNISRYTPRWHQEGIAVFLETWMSGGFGRILGNFDEMYFRSMVLDHKMFPSIVKLDAISTHNSFLTEVLFYLYGARFAAYLAIKYDARKLIDWYKISSKDFYSSFKDKFENVFKVNFDKAWNDFIEYEKQFQRKNIDKLSASGTTNVKKLINHPIGSVSEPHYDPYTKSVLFGFHQPRHLSSIQKFNLSTNQSDIIGTLPTPSQYEVASTAFDYETGFFFYTTNNNQLYRDVWVLDVKTEDTKEIFPDSRIGELTVSPETHELWGVKHSGGKATIIYSPYPYNTLEQGKEFPFGDDIQQLAVSPSGKYLAATYLRSSGEQSIILISCDSLKESNTFSFNYITSSGSPEDASWSLDGEYLYWDAYTNGVSNIYRLTMNKYWKNNKPVALTNTLRGLFKPIDIGTGELFAFEFTSDGFIPVTIKDKPAESTLSAIRYLGEEVIKKNPEVYNWYVAPPSGNVSLKVKNNEEEYNGLENLKILTFIPVISGFQKQKMLGIFTHIADPLFRHDITIETGFSPFNENPLGPKFHFKGKYEYKKQYIFGLDYNAPDFYDLFNDRKRGIIGTKIRLGNVHYWVYDNPLKMKEQSEIAYYRDIVYINDNLVRVSEPDFAVGQTTFNSTDLRRTIGSADFEYGNEFTFTLMVFATNLNKVEYAGQLYGEWGHFTTFLADHNIFHFKLGAGYHEKNDKMFQARFFFGGFGNRALENVNVKQYRSMFRFPGIPIYSLDSEGFVKLLFEDNLPPLRFANASIGQHYLSHLDFSVYSQALYTKSPLGKKWIDLGAQLNLIFKHWFNLESTLSAGIANAWYEEGRSWEWFVSYKLLRN